MRPKSLRYYTSAPNITARRETSRPEELILIDAVVERENMTQALRRVQANKGAPGVDGMTVDELLPYLHKEWLRIKEELLKGTSMEIRHQRARPLVECRSLTHERRLPQILLR